MPHQFRLSTIFIAVAVIGINLAVFRWTPAFGIGTTAMTLAIATICISRRLDKSPFVAAFLGLVTASGGSGLLTALFVSFYAFAPPPDGVAWFFGGGVRMIILEGLLGGIWGAIVSIPIVVVYGLVALFRWVLINRYDRYFVEPYWHDNIR